VYKYILLIITFIFLTQCSLDTKTGFWTKSKIPKEKKDDLEEIFKPAEILEKEFNTNVRIKINSSYTQKPFINNLSNNVGYINFHSNFKEISKFKFKKIKNFDFINPDLLLGDDNSLIFFDDKGSILKFNKDSKLIWKKNHYDKKEIKQKPSIYFATNHKILIAADSIANLYAMDYVNGDLIWKIFYTASFNSEIKIFDDKVFLIDFENVIRCISIQNGKEIWRFATEKSFIKSQRKLSLIIQNGLVIFIDTFGDINALDLNTGRLMWQAQTIKEDIFENAFLLKSSRLVYDNQTIFVSNNQNNFFAIDSRNGIIKWEQTINSYLEPSIIENIVLTVSEEGYLFVIDKKNGNILRSTNTLATIKNKNIYPTGFIAAKNFVYVSLSNGRLLKVGIEDGKTKDVIKIDGNKISRPYIFDKQMYILRDNAIIKVE
jgi:outer membrane protein assembly factor BamB